MLFFYKGIVRFPEKGISSMSEASVEDHIDTTVFTGQKSFDALMAQVRVAPVTFDAVTVTGDGHDITLKGVKVSYEVSGMGGHKLVFKSPGDRISVMRTTGSRWKVHPPQSVKNARKEAAKKTAGV